MEDGSQTVLLIPRGSLMSPESQFTNQRIIFVFVHSFPGTVTRRYPLFHPLYVLSQGFVSLFKLISHSQLFIKFSKSAIAVSRYPAQARNQENEKH